MELVYKTADGRFEVKVEGKSHQDLVEQIASFQEVFENNTVTYNGKTSNKVQWRVREVDDNKYYELVCVDEDFDIKNARLAFGSHKSGKTLFAKRKNEDGSYNKNNGWKKFNKATGKEE